MTETTLPDAATLISAARQAMATVKDDPRDGKQAQARRRRVASRALDQWAPAVDEMVDLADAAKFLRISLDTARRRQNRAGRYGDRDWAAPDVDAGAARAWKYRTLVVHEAGRPGRGRHGSALAPIPGDIAVYLSVADIAEHFGVAANTVHSWRARYRPGRTVEETAEAADCPQPDVIVGRSGRGGSAPPMAGWRADRLAEWDKWRKSLPEHLRRV